jgi:hypothetical protein
MLGPPRTAAIVAYRTIGRGPNPAGAIIGMIRYIINIINLSPVQIPIIPSVFVRRPISTLSIYRFKNDIPVCYVCYVLRARLGGFSSSELPAALRFLIAVTAVISVVSNM